MDNFVFHDSTKEFQFLSDIYFKTNNKKEQNPRKKIVDQIKKKTGDSPAQYEKFFSEKISLLDRVFICDLASQGSQSISQLLKKVFVHDLIEYTVLSLAKRKEFQEYIWEDAVACQLVELAPDRIKASKKKGFYDLSESIEEAGQVVKIIVSQLESENSLQLYLYDPRQNNSQSSSDKKPSAIIEIGALEEEIQSKIDLNFSALQFFQILLNRQKLTSQIQQQFNQSNNLALNGDDLAQLKCMLDGVNSVFYRIIAYKESSRGIRDKSKQLSNQSSQFYISMLNHIIELFIKESNSTGIIDDQSGVTELCNQNKSLFQKGNQQNIFEKLLLDKKQSTFRFLIKEMETLLKIIPDHADLKEAIRIWFDYMGQLILFVDELKENKKSRVTNHHTKLTQQYFGLVFVSADLINQALVANQQLNSSDKISEDDKKFLANKILLTQYFSLNMLPKIEGYVNIIRRNSDCYNQISFN